MKIALVTTHTGLVENKRIEEEVLALGHEFQLIDLSPFNYSIRDNKLVVPGLTDLHADVAIFRGIFLSLKAISAAADALQARGIKVFDNSLLTHHYTINKITDILKLGNGNIPLPETYYGRAFEHYPREAMRIGYPVVVKLTRAGKGAGIYKIGDAQALKQFISKKEADGYKGASYIMQEFFDYEHDLRILVIGDSMFTMKRTPPEGDFRANFSLGGAVEPFAASDATKTLAKEALAAIDMSVGGVDVLIGKDGREVVLEVNHTAGFVGMEKALGQNITQYYVKHAIAAAK